MNRCGGESILARSKDECRRVSELKSVPALELAEVRVARSKAAACML